MTDTPNGPAVAITPDLLRARHEREAADRVYNDALTALDRAIQHLREFPGAPAPMDASRLASLNERWQLLASRPFLGGRWLKPIRKLVWEMLEPLWARQEQFNATLVDHLNRNADSQRQTSAALADLLRLVREELTRLVAFESKLVQYAQTITAYVDTKDRSVEALPLALHSAFEAAADELDLRWESFAAQHRRFQNEIDEIRATSGVANHAIQTLKRAIERLAASDRSATGPAGTPPVTTTFTLDSYKYVGFEDHFRGAPLEIRDRLQAYVPTFSGCSDVLDIGCGRGEFLDLLREHGVTARGVDLNDEMVAICRSRGLDAGTMDALSYLQAQPDGSLGGLFGAQVVEHLDPDYLLRLLDTAYHKLRPGSPVVLETINPACWFAFFSSYIRDITHVRAIHPDTLRYLLVASGFQQLDIRYAAPYPESSKLQPVDVPPGSPLAPAAAVFNENAAKLNALLFTYLDYAAIAKRA
jgi:SAM-dependent methyltransferase